MRGKPIISLAGIEIERITPACAGKTTGNTGRTGRSQDHPRVCGENLAVAVLTAAEKGSPPRVRGKLTLYLPDFRPHRITPACAGKTHGFLRALSCCQDHPRVCGENRSFSENPAPISGSPPRVRGKHGENRTEGRPEGITPACAGKTKFCLVISSSIRDHPRVCGENPVNPTQTIRGSGSPPRVRGKQNR